MQAPATPAEQLYIVYGDELYRYTLALVGSERHAHTLLRTLATDLPATIPDLPLLLQRLLQIARRSGPHPGRRWWPRPAPELTFGPFLLQSLSIEQRALLLALLLFGFQSEQLATLLATTSELARSTLNDAVRRLGSAVGLTLTDQLSDEQCLSIRALLVDPSLGSRQSGAVRGHMAVCAHCRAFDHAWIGITQAVEVALRTALRERTMPASLMAKLAQTASMGPGLPLLRMALVPLVVLGLIAALIIPNRQRAPLPVGAFATSEPIAPRELIDRALERHMRPPERDGVWYGRYETLWYFSNDLYAPLLAEIWLDPGLPGRHRLQLSHRDGGAPYELQVGDGVRRLSYALDAAYAPSIYGALPIRARPGTPALLDQSLDTAAQQRARDERLRSGPWMLVPNYLQQARVADDLRLLGRQREGQRTVQILSFSAITPLGWPDGTAPEAEQVTVLLAIDPEDGLLYRITELVGPAGGVQVSRTIWRLLSQDWLSGSEQIRTTFAIERAWSGVGEFSEASLSMSADFALPLVAARTLADPTLLLDPGAPSVWLPALPPPGIDRALLIWPNADLETTSYPESMIYLGSERRLIMIFRQFAPPQAPLEGGWQVALQPSRLGRYSATLTHTASRAELQIESWGFTRAELLALIATLSPAQRTSILAQADLFVQYRSE